MLLKFNNRVNFENEFVNKLTKLESTLERQFEECKDKLNECATRLDLNEKLGLGLDLKIDEIVKQNDIKFAKFRSDVETIQGFNNKLYNDFHFELEKIE